MTILLSLSEEGNDPTGKCAQGGRTELAITNKEP